MEQETSQKQPAITYCYPLAALGICMGGVLIMMPLFFTSSLVLAFGRWEKLDFARSYLWPTFLANLWVILGVAMMAFLVVFLGLRWFRAVWGKTGRPLKTLMLLIVTSALPLGLGLFLLFADDGDAFPAAMRCASDLMLLQRGETQTYDAIVTPSEALAMMEGIYYQGKPRLAVFWDLESKSRQPSHGGQFYSTVACREAWKAQKSARFLPQHVEYLPNTKIICSMTPMDRWSEKNTVIDADFLSRLENVKEMPEQWDHFFGYAYASGRYEELRGALQDPAGTVRRVSLNLDDDYTLRDGPRGGEDFVLVAEGNNTEVAIAMVSTPHNIYENHFLPKEVLLPGVRLSLLESKSYWLHDILMEYGDIRAVLQFDGTDYVMGRIPDRDDIDRDLERLLETDEQEYFDLVAEHSDFVRKYGPEELTYEVTGISDRQGQRIVNVTVHYRKGLDIYHSDWELYGVALDKSAIYLYDALAGRYDILLWSKPGQDVGRHIENVVGT